MVMIMGVLYFSARNVINTYFKHMVVTVGYALAVARDTPINGHIL